MTVGELRKEMIAMPDETVVIFRAGGEWLKVDDFIYTPPSPSPGPARKDLPLLEVWLGKGRQKNKA